MLHGRAELSHQDLQHEFALIWRYDYLIDFSEDAAEVYNAYKKELSPSLKKEYLGNLSASHTSALGLRWAPKFHPANNLIIFPALNLLKGKKLTEGSIQGITQFIGAGFSGNDIGDTSINISYHYDHPLIHERDLDWYPPSPVGYGASLDLRFIYKPIEASLISLNLYDVIGEIYWKEVPKTLYDFSYTNKPKSFNLNGVLSIDDRFTQKLPMHGTFAADLRVQNKWHAGLSLQGDRYVWLAQVYAGYQHNDWLTKILVEPQSQAFGVNIEHQYFSLRWLSDSLKADQAHRLGLDASVRIPFGSKK